MAKSSRSRKVEVQKSLLPSSRHTSNPFNYGSPIDPDRFYGRWQARSDIKNRIGARTAQSINIVGLRRMGKTSLLRYVRERINEFCLPEQKPLVVSLDFQDRRFHTPEGITEGLRRGIQRQYGKSFWEREENEDPHAVEDGLMALRVQGHRLIVMIDEFEGVAQRLEVFQDWGEDWRAKTSAGLLTLVIATKQTLNEIYEPLQLTSPFHNIFSATVLGAMENSVWQQLVEDGFETQTTDFILEWVEDLTGGWPFLVQMAASLFWQHGSLEKAESEFCVQTEHFFPLWWAGLSNDERVALQTVVSTNQVDVKPATLARLQRYGWITVAQRCFSSIFANWIRAQKP